MSGKPRHQRTGRGGKSKSRAAERPLGDKKQWVACDRCGKWRGAPPSVSLQSLTATSVSWFCSLGFWSEELTRRGCAVPEEDTDGPVGGSSATPGADEAIPSAGDAGAVSSDPLVTDDAAVKPAEDVDAQKKKKRPGQPDTAMKSAKKPGSRRAAVQWVQCENTACNKWWQLPPEVSLRSLPEHFFCHLNWWQPDAGKCRGGGDDTTNVKGETSEADISVAVTSDEQPAGQRLPDVVDCREATLVSSNDATAIVTRVPPLVKEAAVVVPPSVAPPQVGPVSHSAPGKKRRRGDAALLAEVSRGPSRGFVTRSGVGSRVSAFGSAFGSSSGAGGRSTVNSSATSQSVVSGGASGHVSLTPARRPLPLPPAYVTGHTDYHNLGLLHPPEVWSTLNGSNDASRQAWQQSATIGSVSSISAGQHAKVSYHDVVSTSWQKRGGSGSHQQSDRSLTALESHLRWSRSSMYAVDATASAAAGAALPLSEGGATDALSSAVPEGISKSNADLADTLWNALVACDDSAVQSPRPPQLELQLVRSAERACAESDDVLSTAICIALSSHAMSWHTAIVARADLLVDACLPDCLCTSLRVSDAVSGLSLYLPRTGDLMNPRSMLREVWAPGRLYAKNLTIRPSDIVTESVVESVRWTGAVGALAEAVDAATRAAGKASSDTIEPRLSAGGSASGRPCAAHAAVEVFERAVFCALVFCLFSWHVATSSSVNKSALSSRATFFASCFDSMHSSVGPSSSALSRVLLAAAFPDEEVGFESLLDSSASLGPAAVAARIQILTQSGIFVSSSSTGSCVGRACLSESATSVLMAVYETSSGGVLGSTSLVAAIHALLVDASLSQPLMLPPDAARSASVDSRGVFMGSFLPLRLLKPWRC
jgi:hypothetical protein